MKKLQWLAGILAAAVFWGLCPSEVALAAESAEVASDIAATEEETAAAAVEADSSVANTTNKKMVISNADFSTVVNCGINGNVVYDTPTQVQITVKCVNDFTGSIRLIPDTDTDYWTTTVAYEQDITLVAGEEKTITFYPSAIGSAGQIKISILNESGKEIYAETDNVSMSYSGDSLMVGVLSDDFAALNYMNGLYITSDEIYGYSKLLELTDENFPENSGVLRMLNFIVIDNYDTAKLSEAQYEALREWVEDGGVLILGLGANYQNVLHAFTDDFVSGTIGSLTQTSITWPNLPSESVTSYDAPENGYVSYSADSVESGLTEAVTLDGVDTLSFTLDGGECMDIFADGAAAWRKDVGAGTVVVLSYDLAMEPVADFDWAEQMAYALIMTATDSDFSAIYSYISYEETAEEIASLNDSTKRPSVVVIAMILIIYVILAGPVLYLILKACGKREKIWLAIPATAVVFTLVIYIFTLSYQIGSPIVNTFTIVELSDSAQKETVYVSVTCPQAKEHELLLHEDYTDLLYNPYNWDYTILDIGADASSEYDYILKETNEGLKLVLENDTAFQKTNFAVKRTAENQIGSLNLELSCYTSGFEGTVTNHTGYDLQGVVVYFEDNYYEIGKLKQGESAEVALADNRIFNYYGDTFSSYAYYGYSASLIDREDYLEQMVSSLMETSYIDQDYGHGGAWGYIADYPVDVCADEDVDQNGCAVVYTSFTAEYADVTGVYYADIAELMVDYTGDYDPYDNMMYTETLDMTYQFAEEDQITALTNRNYGVQDSTGSTYSWSYVTYADVYAYNTQTGDYEQIFTDGAVIEGEELAKYLDDDDKLQLRYVIDGADMYDAYMPVISAIGGEQDAAD